MRRLAPRRYAGSSPRLADFKVPRRVVFLDAIPKGPTGKASRAKLAEQFRTEVSLRGGDTGKPKGAAPADLYREPAAFEAAEAPRPLEGVEARLVKIWKRVLGIPHVGVHDDFFGLGGDSLSAALMLAEIEEALKTGTDRSTSWSSSISRPSRASRV